MKLRIVKNKSAPMKAFSDKEWSIADIEHYGRPVSRVDTNRYINAINKGEIVGILSYDTFGGVMKIRTFIVSSKKRRQGIGKLLFEKAQEVAKKESIHKIHLTTGEGWDAIKFYEVLGFKKTASYPNHYHRKDFIEMSKFLNTK